MKDEIYLFVTVLCVEDFIFEFSQGSLPYQYIYYERANK